MVGLTDPARPYWPGSPTSPMWTGAAANDPDHGTMHIWDVWNTRDYEAYREHRPRFAAEFGYQGPPTWSTLAHAVGIGELAVDSASLAHHQKATDGMAKLERGLDAALSRRPADFDDWLYLTQLNQARAVSLGVEHLRSIRDICSGTIVWQLNDCWPVHLVGRHRRRRSSQAACGTRCGAPTRDRLLTIQPTEYRLRAVLVNEAVPDWSTEVHARRMRLDGDLLAEVRLSARVGPRSMTALDLPTSVAVPQHATDEILVIDAGTLRSVWTWLPDRDLRYPEARRDASVDAEPAGYRVSDHGTHAAARPVPVPRPARRRCGRGRDAGDAAARRDCHLPRRVAAAARPVPADDPAGAFAASTTGFVDRAPARSGAAAGTRLVTTGPCGRAVRLLPGLIRPSMLGPWTR